MNIRRIMLSLVVAGSAVLFAGSAQSKSIWVTSAVHDCAFAPDDTVRVDVMISTNATVDDGGCQVTYDPTRLSFVKAERGSLVASWATFTPFNHGAYLTIDAAGTPVIPDHVTGQFARLVFVATCCGAPTTQTMLLCPQGSGDLYSYPNETCGKVTCVPATPGGLTVGWASHACGDAQGDTVEVDVRVENATQAIDAAGADLPFDAAHLEYVGYRRGALTAAWPFFDVAKVAAAVRFGGFTSTPISAGATGVFVTLRFVVTCCTGQGFPLCPQLLVDDFATLEPGCGQVTCMALGTQAASWGAVKARYRQ